MSDYFICPNCGTEVPIKALSCPECGSDEKTGWSEDTMYDGLDLPEVEESKTRTTTSLFQKQILFIHCGYTCPFGLFVDLCTVEAEMER